MPTTITAAHNALVDDIISDPSWFPLRYDVRGDAILFARIPPETHRALTFLSDFRPTETCLIPRAELGEVESAPLHTILHSGLGGSTLLARALAEPGVVTTLKEPPILTDVVAFGLQAGRDEEQRLLGPVASLLARPFSAGEAIVSKMSSVGNGLCATIARVNLRSRVLCLQTPLDQFLASLVSKGTQGRSGGRRLFTGLQNARMTCVTLSEGQLQDHSDLQLAALAWLSIQKMIRDVGDEFGPDRVRSIDSDAMLDDPRAALAAIADHLGVRLDVEARLASGVFTRHAKTGEQFDTKKRAAVLSKTLEDHGAEILPIVDWARKVSDATAIAWDLPYPLLS